MVYLTYLIHSACHCIWFINFAHKFVKWHPTKIFSCWPLKRSAWSMRVHKLYQDISLFMANLFNQSNPPKWVIMTGNKLHDFNVRNAKHNVKKFECPSSNFIITYPLVGNFAFRKWPKMVKTLGTWNCSSTFKSFKQHFSDRRWVFLNLYKVDALDVWLAILKHFFHWQNLVV